jgi:hypothetical protein
MKKTFALAVIIFLAFLPLLASADEFSSPDVWNISILKGPFLTCSGDSNAANDSSTYAYTCHNLCDLVENIVWDIYVAMAYVIWIILPISFITGGIMYMLGGANPGLIETAKKTLWGAFIGAIIVLCAYLLIATFLKFMKITGIGGFGTPTCTITEKWDGSSKTYI